jgi:hypothetical protein
MLRLLTIGRSFATRAKARSHRCVAQREFSSLLFFLRRHNCTFHSCEALIRNPIPRGVSFRYDIHVRDLPGSAAFVDLHNNEKIPGTFFLFWDYSKLERDHFSDFMGLAGRITAPLQIGLHDSPVDAHLIQERFDGDRRAYLSWLKSDAMIDWVRFLLARPAELAALNDRVMSDLHRRVSESRRHFGQISAVASHGGELNQVVRPLLGELEPRIGALARQLGRTWLTPERIKSAGLMINVDGHGQERKGWREQSDGGGVIAKMTRRIQQYILEEKSALQILIHPYTWSGGKRDAELSALLCD